MDVHTSQSLKLRRSLVMGRHQAAQSNPTRGSDVPTDHVPGDLERSLAGLLLAGALAAVLVVADQLINSWADGHMLAGWVALWTLTFATLAFMASPLRRMAALLADAVQLRLQALSLRRPQARIARKPRT